MQSNLAAILMASTPLTATALAHFFTNNEKINLTKSFGILIGFSGIVFLFSDNFGKTGEVQTTDCGEETQTNPLTFSGSGTVV